MVDGDGDIIVIEPVKEMLLQRQRPAVTIMVTVESENERNEDDSFTILK